MLRADSVDWSSLRDAYGPATDVPGLLRALYGDDLPAREAAIGDLWSSLCHQDTVYSASAAAVPFLVEAGRAAPLTGLQRFIVLSLVVHIGRGEDGCWEGYTSIEQVRARERAVAAAAAGIVRWSAGEGVAERAIGLELLAYFPGALGRAGVALSDLVRDMTEPRLAAAADLVGAIVAGEAIGEGRLRAAAATDEDTADFLAEGLTDAPPQRRARAVVLELVDRAAAAALTG